ncbi:GntR family transcriptional regulator [Methylorubrum rhodesianum]|jgi:DNA-binding GntR family transcriptional regulator|uniref:GntR family transcriptional regulator n=1 Tax=Methylorubrum rhodesianum TaxID=29427 RepID=UPI0037466D8A
MSGSPVTIIDRSARSRGGGDAELRVPDADGGCEASDTPQTETQSQMAYRIIEEMIVTLEVPPGSLISEKALNRQLGIGRTPIREALQRLALEGTVRIVPRAGVIVSEIDMADQLKMIEVRREIEKIIAGRAARLADPDTCSHFRRLAARFDEAAQAGDEKIFIATDREFNALIVTSAQNSYAAHAIGPIEAQTRRFWYLHFKRFGDLRRVCELHSRIALAVAENDEPAARKASDELLDYVESYTIRTLEALR